MSAEPTEPEYRFYGELATWWPLISPPEDYLEEAEFIATVLGSATEPVAAAPAPEPPPSPETPPAAEPEATPAPGPAAAPRPEVLELGSGGGHNAAHLKKQFTMTLVDLSEDMLEVSRRLNPECTHQQGDMRTVRLGRTFDAVFVHDAVDYMTTREDLALAVTTAYEHCRPGGTAVFVPDDTAESFEESSDHGGRDGVDDQGLPSVRGVRYLEWTWDPDPTDSWVLTEYTFLLRDLDGSVRVVHETHRFGVFHRDVWLELLTGAGFDTEVRVEETSEDRPGRLLFIGHRPI